MRFVRLLAIAMAPCPLILLKADSLPYLHISKIVRFVRNLAIAMAPSPLILLLSELPYCLLMCKIVIFFIFYATNCAPLIPISKSKNQPYPFYLS
jgi:hypothetical protein